MRKGRVILSRFQKTPATTLCASQGERRHAYVFFVIFGRYPRYPHIFCMLKKPKWDIISIKWDKVVYNIFTHFAYAHRGIQTHYRRQKPLVTSRQIPKGNGKESCGNAWTGFMSLHLYGERVGNNIRTLVGVRVLDVAGG